MHDDLHHAAADWPIPSIVVVHVHFIAHSFRTTGSDKQREINISLRLCCCHLLDLRQWIKYIAAFVPYHPWPNALFCLHVMMSHFNAVYQFGSYLSCTGLTFVSASLMSVSFCVYRRVVLYTIKHSVFARRNQFFFVGWLALQEDNCIVWLGVSCGTARTARHHNFRPSSSFRPNSTVRINCLFMILNEIDLPHELTHSHAEENNNNNTHTYMEGRKNHIRNRQQQSHAVATAYKIHREDKQKWRILLWVWTPRRLIQFQCLLFRWGFFVFHWFT